MMRTDKTGSKPRQPRTVIIQVDRDGDRWLVTGKRARRRLLTRDEFLEMVQTSSVVVTHEQPRQTQG